MAWWYGLLQRQVLALAGFLVVVAAQAPAADQAVDARMRKDITFLASDECEGRGVTTKGINLAADYIANEFKQAGLKPAGNEGSYFQPFTMRGPSKLGSPNALVLRGPLGQRIELQQGVDFQVLGLSRSGQLSAPLVFVGYGATAKEIDHGDYTGKEIDYDDYKGIDVAGKVVLIVRKAPRFENEYVPFDGRSSAYHAALGTKVANAAQHHAAAVLIVNDRGTAQTEDGLMEFGYTSQDYQAELPALQLRRAVVDTILQSSLGRRLLELEQDIDRDLQPRSAALAGWTIHLEVHVSRAGIPVKNVVGVLEGSGPLAEETVVIGAHYDHLGYGDFGSLARRPTSPTPPSEGGAGGVRGAIHHGADDNGSGTTALIELARRFGRMQGRPGRRLVFIAFTGEESGLFGSAHYCKEPLFPLADTVAMLNMDMVGRLRPDNDSHQDKLIVYGTGSATRFDALLESVNHKYDFKLQKVASGMGPSDQQSFYMKNIPVLFFFTGDHADYHRPSDTADKINVAGMARVADLVENLIVELQSVPERPKYVRVPSTRGPGGMRRGGPRLGIMPEYGDSGEGVLLSGVVEGAAAAKAGLKEGDRIVEMAGKPVKNLEAYMALMAGQKKGEFLEVAILRDGKRMTFKVALE
jgi:hypothetical protein